MVLFGGHSQRFLTIFPLAIIFASWNLHLKVFCLFQHFQEGKECCWTCVKCTEEQYLYNETSCKSCHRGWWPNINKTGAKFTFKFGVSHLLSCIDIKHHIQSYKVAQKSKFARSHISQSPICTTLSDVQLFCFTDLFLFLLRSGLLYSQFVS